MTEIWQRQEYDTNKSFEAFCVYRDMEDRTLRKVARQLNKSLTQIGKWSEPHNWVERVGAYDDHLREQERLRYEAEKRKAKAERHRMIRAAKGKAALKLDRLDVDDMSAAEFIRFLQMILTEERNEFDDLPKQKTEHSGEVNGKLQIEYVNDWREALDQS